MAIVEKFKQESMYGLSTKKVAVVERRPFERGLNKSQCMDGPPKKVVVRERWPL